MKKERSVLKTYFATNKIPTADNFGELIDSAINQAEDGIKKDAGGPVSIQAEGMGDGVQDLLYFYKNFNDANPSWRINQNPRTNVQDPGSGRLGLNIGDATGISRLFIKSDDGNIGIGTITPSQKLSVNGNVLFGIADNTAIGMDAQESARLGIIKKIGFFPQICSSNNAPIIFGQTNQNDVFTNISGATITERMRISEKGNVGIGTNAPGFPLNFANVLGDKIALWGSSGSHYGFGIQGNLLQIHTDIATSDIAFGYGSSAALAETMRIKGNGNVGIGINPEYKLHVNGSVSLGGFTTGDTADEWPNVVWSRNAAANWDDGLIKGNSARGVFGRAGFGIHMHQTRHFCFYSTGWDPLVDIEGGSGRMYIKGNVGIANPSPGLTLDVQGNLGIKNAANWDHMYLAHDGVNAFIRAGGAEGGLHLQVSKTNAGGYGAQSYTPGLVVTGDGNLGLGTVGAVVDFGYSVSGREANAGKIGYGTFDTNSLCIVGAGTSSPSRRITFWAEGGARFYGSVTSNNGLLISDERIKSKVLKSNREADLAILNQLEVSNYIFKDKDINGTGLNKGFIAQQVEKFFPQAVSRQTDFIPSIFSTSQSVTIDNAVLTVALVGDHGLETGDIVRLITPTGNKDAAVAKIDNNVFAVNDWTDDVSSVFVYGKKVDDFRSVNYNAIFTLGISAVQELYRQMQQLKQELSEAKEKLFSTLIPTI